MRDTGYAIGYTMGGRMTDDEAKIELFWSRVDRSGGPDACWPWTGAMTIGGGGRRYGSFCYRGKVCRANRLALELARGSIPQGLLACHTCDNPPCCNPNHLFAGTHRDNTQDMIKKGRATRARMMGESNPNVRLTVEQVKEIRLLHFGGESIRSIAREFESDTKYISLIVHNKRRKAG